MLAYSLTISRSRADGRPDAVLVETIPVPTDIEAICVAKSTFERFVARQGAHAPLVAALSDELGDLVWQSAG